MSRDFIIENSVLIIARKLMNFFHERKKGTTFSWTLIDKSHICHRNPQVISLHFHQIRFTTHSMTGKIHKILTDN